MTADEIRHIVREELRLYYKFLEIDSEITALNIVAQVHMGGVMNTNMSLIFDLRMKKECIQGKPHCRKKAEGICNTFYWYPIQKEEIDKFTPIYEDNYIVAWEEKK